ncbi:MAG: exodeoxyribonuclease VII large subunit [Hyphomicrobiales bacterium]|nr:exodeoxyribonuclease VII large subunit [Hyphomicrobiales bacterium]
MNTPSHNVHEYTVSEISQALKRTVEEQFEYVRVRGEISGFKRAASGHLYFSLKDEKSVLNSICWRGVASKLPFAPEDGLEVIATGKLSTYPGRSNYQLIAEFMEPAGIGALMALLEKRKQQLAKEGLFDENRKRPLPYLPEVIGVVTSPTGAVIRDILHRITDRFPVRVLVWPVLVQGEGAAEQVAAAIAGFNAMPKRPDVLIVARGGGSLEDLWAFNEEIVVRAAAASEIPLISAVGHETDTTLIDYAADQRAPTPTAAAEMAVPVKSDLLYTVQDHGLRMHSLLSRRLEHAGTRLSGLARGLISPRTMLETMVQRLDDWSERLGAALPAYFQQCTQMLALASSRLQPTPLQQAVRRYETQLAERGTQLNGALTRQLSRQEERLGALSRLLESYHYQKVLARGFVLVRDSADQLITRAANMPQNARLSLEFHDGRQIVTSGDTPPSSATKTPGNTTSGASKLGKQIPGTKKPGRVTSQGSLFE